jgi:hypothetical protein
MATVVYPIPATPSKEKGAKDDKFFSRQRGNRINVVTVRRVMDLETSIPTVDSSALKVSARIML